MLGNSTMSDYDRVAASLKTYEGAEAFILQKVAPITDQISAYLFPSIGFALALLVLAFWMLRLKIDEAMRYFFFLVFIAVAMVPVNIGGDAKLPAIPYYANKITTALLGALQDVVDRTIKSPGTGRNFAAPMRPLSLYALAGRQDLRDTALTETMRIYTQTCSPVTGNTMTRAELRAVGLAGGPVGVETAESRKVKSNAIRKLADLPATGTAIGYIPSPWAQGGFVIESAQSWRARGQRPDLAPGFIKNTDPSLQLKDAGTWHGMEYQFFAVNCKDMYRITELAAKEYLSMIAERVRTAQAEAGMGADADRDGLVLLGAQLTAAHNINAATETKPEAERGMMTGLAGSILSGIETLLITAGMKVVSWISELVTKWFVGFIPGVVALGIGLAFILYPIVVLLSLLPGRERSIGMFLYAIVFLKLYLLIAYIVLKVGGLVFTEAVDQFARSGGETSFAALTFIGGLVIVLAVIWGAPALAFAIVFSQTHGLAGAVGFGAVGGSQIQRAAGQVTGRVSAGLPSGRGSQASTAREASTLSPTVKGSNTNVAARPQGGTQNRSSTTPKASRDKDA